MKEIPPLRQPEYTEMPEEGVWSARATQRVLDRIRELQQNGMLVEEDDRGKITVRNRMGKVVLYEDKDRLKGLYEEELKLREFADKELKKKQMSHGDTARQRPAIHPLDELLLRPLPGEEEGRGN